LPPLKLLRVERFDEMAQPVAVEIDLGCVPGGGDLFQAHRDMPLLTIGAT
jgi:hypothetical protein